MKIYQVGGAVRDALLGLPVHDRDWLVVGGTPEAMVAQGFTPVGRDFPVFLHPRTHEEYALARTERKSGHGYQGFTVYTSPDVTLEEDLARRDLTINAIAAPADWTGAEGIFDPYHGVADLHAKVLRHVTEAFAEDPVRILRVARFAARFTDFSVAPETMALMQAMVQAGEVAHLVPERVWQEISRGLMEAQPERMFAVLRACGALAVLLPELDRLWGVPQRADYHPEVDTGLHTMLVLGQAVQQQAPLAVRWACLVHDLGKGTTPADVLPRHIGHEQRGAKLVRQVCQRLRVPSECKELAELVAYEHGNIHRSQDRVQRRYCACCSAAMPCASRSGLGWRCGLVSAMRGGAGGLRLQPIRSAGAWHRRWRWRWVWPPGRLRRRPWQRGSRARRLGRRWMRCGCRRWGSG